MQASRPGLSIEVDNAIAAAANTRGSEGSAPVTVVHVAGELDFGTRPAMLRQMNTHYAGGGTVVLDLAGVTFCDSSGLGALVTVHDEAAAAGCRLFLAAPRPQVAKALAYTALDQLFTIFHDVPAAVAVATDHLDRDRGE